MRKSFDAKNRLMETAILLIQNSHYDNVGVAEICKQTGVTKGCFYHHFESKGDLFYQASRYYREGMKIVLDDVFSEAYPPIERVERLINCIIQKQEENKNERNAVPGCPFFSNGMSAGADAEKVRLAAREMTASAVQYNTKLASDLHKSGALTESTILDFNFEQTGRMLYQYIMGLLLYGSVEQSLDAVKADLRTGVYRILGIPLAAQ